MIFYVAQTHANPVGIAYAIAMGVLLLLLPRRYAVLPIIVLIGLMTMGTNIVVLGFNFTMLRLLLVFGWARLILRWEFRGLKLNRIDALVIVFVISTLLVYTVLWQTYDAFKEKLGFAYNVLGFFFLFRCLIRDLQDAVRVVRMAAVVIVPLAIAMVVEKNTGHDLFAYFGGVPEMSPVRDGVIRCQGPFGHPILAGSFAATLLPLFLGLAFQKVKWAKLSAGVGVVCAGIVVACSGSSGPVLAGLAGIFGFSLWVIRAHMRTLRWGLVLALVALHLVMKPPVWFIIAKIDIFSGNTGWHRAHLIDIAYKNFFDWWLVGTRSVDNWDAGYDHNIDITNQYISYGIDGGLLAFSLFIGIIVRCFRGVGRSLKAAWDQPRAARIFIWALGAALFAHTVNYFSISYFDQNIISWYMLLAVISSLSDYCAALGQTADCSEETSQPEIQFGYARDLVDEAPKVGRAVWSPPGASPLSGFERFVPPDRG